MIYVIHIVEVILVFSIILLCSIGAVFIYAFIEEWCESRQQKRYEQRYRETNEKYWQRIRRKELHKREREKYPLFYWRELVEEKLEDAE